MPRRDVSMTADEITRFLGSPRTGILSTLKGGWPHLTAMWFVPEADELQMWAYAKSQKVRNVERDPRSALVTEDGDSYDSLRGVSVQGRIRLVTDTEEIFDIGRRLYERYTLPTTGIAVADGPEIELRRQAQKRVGLVLPMERIASWDHSKIGG